MGDGSFSVYGVINEFSAYVCSHYAEFHEATWEKLFVYIEQCVTTDVHSEAGIANAVCTCFLENIAGEGMLSRTVSKYFGPESRKYFEHWDNVG